MKRCQRRRVVPIEKVPVILLETFKRGERVVETTNQRLRREVPEIVCGQRRQERHADVGRRGAPRESRLVPFLVVVWRQPAVRFGDERLVEEPRLPRGSAQPPAVGTAQAAAG